MTMRTRIAAALALVVLLGGCAGQSPAPPSTAGPAPQTPAPAQTPAETPTPVLTATIPTECTDVVDPATYAATFSTVPLVDSDGTGAVVPTPPPAGATYREIVMSGVELRCDWDDVNSDFNALDLIIGTVTPNVGAAYLDQLADDGYRCEDVLDGRRCQRVGPVEGFPEIEQTSTWFLRDDVFIQVGRVTFPTSGLLAAIVERVWS